MPHRHVQTARAIDARRGALALMATLLLPVVLLMIGLAVDGGLLYATAARLATAARGAAHSALRGVDADDAEAIARAVFDANFPDGRLMARSRQVESIEIADGEIRVLASAEAPTLFLRLLGKDLVEIRRTARASFPAQRTPVRLLADSDAFGPDLTEIQDLARLYPGCGGGDPAVCVNADVPGGTLFTRGRDITPYENMAVHMGTARDPAFFTETGEALSPAEAEDVVGRTVCAKVYSGELEGVPPASEPIGSTAFSVTSLTPAPEGRAFSPHWIVRLLPAAQARSLCKAPAADLEP